MRLAHQNLYLDLLYFDLHADLHSDLHYDLHFDLHFDLHCYVQARGRMGRKKDVTLVSREQVP